MSFSIAKNIGLFDQFIRLGISSGMIYFGFYDLSLIQDKFSATIVGIFGTLNLIVALIRFCPLYAVTGINTYCKPESKKEHV